MQQREIGQSGIQASAVALGCWTFGGMAWGGAEEKESISAIHAALDAGTTILDTAPIYGFGESEEVVGKALKGRRDQVVLATKCGMNWTDGRGEKLFTARGNSVTKNLFPDAIAKELEESLRRLGTDYVDLYQTHWQTQTTPAEETMAELMKMKEQGKIRAIGACNAEPADMDGYRKVGPLASDQPRYSLMDRGIEGAVLPYCRENDMAVLAYSPMAQGLLTGKVVPGRNYSGDDQRQGNPWVRDTDALERLLKVLGEVFQPIADGHDLTLAQLALAWVLGQYDKMIVLAGARKPEQAEQNAAAGEVQLTDEEMKTMADAIAGIEPPEKRKKK